MNILILGSGGREHALAWAVAQNPKCDRLFAAPGNAGIAQVATCTALDPQNGAQVLAFAQAKAIDLVLIGPEAPLAAGVSDHLRAAGVCVFGPSQAAAQLEVSKTLHQTDLRCSGDPNRAVRNIFRRRRRAGLCQHPRHPDCGQSRWSGRRQRRDRGNDEGARP